MSSKKPNNKKKKVRRNWAFWICEITSVVMFIAGFFVPPMGVVDGSVLTGIGLLMGFGTIAMLPDIIAAGHSAKVSLPGGTSIELKKRGRNDGDQSSESTPNN